jgi:hypothetical protein
MQAQAFTNPQGEGTPSAVAYAAAFPTVDKFRIFSPGNPSSVENTVGKGMIAQGLHMVFSCKPPIVPTDAGNALLASSVKTLTGRDDMTTWHEPEDNMTAAQYVHMFQNTYNVCKPTNKDVSIYPIYNGYQMADPKLVANPADWDVGDNFSDGMGLDAYSYSWYAKPPNPPLPLRSTPGYKRWVAWAKSTGRPLHCNELGVADVFSDQQRADWYRAAVDTLLADGFVSVAFWNGALTTPGTDQFGYWGGAKAWPITAATIQDISKQLNTPPPPPPLPPPPDTPLQIATKTLQQRVGAVVDGAPGLETVSKSLAVIQTQDNQIAKAIQDLGSATS